MRSSIIKYFECRGCGDARDLTDEVINRVARKVVEGTEIPADSLTAYFYGVARNILRERLRSSERQPLPIESLSPHQQPTNDPGLFRLEVAARQQSERRIACLEACVERLPVETRSLILSYYEGQEGAKIANRKRLAQTLRIPMSNLRIRVHRIREKLESCLTECLNHSAA